MVGKVDHKAKPLLGKLKNLPAVKSACKATTRHTARNTRKDLEYIFLSTIVEV